MNLFKYIVLIVSVMTFSACQNHNKSLNDPRIYNDAQNFDVVNKEIQRLNSLYGEKNVLIVLDIDNTLLTSEINLGGDIWFQWQDDQLPIKPTSDEKVACLYKDAIGLLYELGTMKLTENDVPQLIENWQSNNNTVFALTSRSPKSRAATERELTRRNINFETSALKPIGKKVPLYAGQLKRPYSYIRGIMMTTGMDKGEMLKLILKKTKRTFKAVVFVDDSKKNINNMFNAYQSTAIDMSLFHYTKIEADRKAQYGAVLTQEQADKMARSWNVLNALLKQIFIGRDVGDGCLGT